MLAGLAGLGAVGIVVPHEAAVAVTADRTFVPPEGPVAMTRSLVRTLADGRELEATRRYLIRFVPDGEGWRVEGQLQDISINVPPPLEGLAALERGRIEPDLFPMLIDRAGQFRPGTAAPPDPQLRARALRLSESMLARTAASRDASAMLTQIIAAGAEATPWPRDLFNPGPEVFERRDITLPGGGPGRISLTLRSVGQVPGRLPARFERIIASEVGGTSRTSREVWTFTAP